MGQDQQDLFADDFDRPRVFRFMEGAFIGAFNRQATGQGGELLSPVRRLSAYLPSEEAAQAALDAGVWPPVETEEP